jgi:hypothetical protein
MTYTSCQHCGALSAPWSGGHSPQCSAFTPPPRARVCSRCRHIARVAAVRRAPRVEVDFTCRGCGHRWTETNDADTEPPNLATADSDSATEHARRTTADTDTDQHWRTK